MSINRIMPTTIHNEVRERVRAHARAAGAHECCGALLGRVSGDGRVIEDALPAPNQSPDTTRRYLIGPDELLRLEGAARATGLDVVGFYHSHVAGPAAPSPVDVALAWPWYTYMILVPGAEPTAWRLRADRSAFEPEALAWVA